MKNEKEDMDFARGLANLMAGISKFYLENSISHVGRFETEAGEAICVNNFDSESMKYFTEAIYYDKTIRPVDKTEEISTSESWACKQIYFPRIF